MPSVLRPSHSRTGLPGLGFKIHSYIRAGIFFAGLALMGIGLAAGLAAVAAIGGLASAGMVASINRLHRLLGGGRLGLRNAATAAWVLLVAPLVMLRIHFKREVNWRGRSYKLDAGSRLEATGAAEQNACVECGPA